MRLHIFLGSKQYLNENLKFIFTKLMFVVVPLGCKAFRFSHLLSRAPPITENRSVRCDVTLPLSLGHDPGVTQGVPELVLLRRQAVDEQLDGVDGQQRRHHFGRQVGAVVRVVRRVDNLEQICNCILRS